MWWWKLLILEVMGHAGSLERCSISLYFQNIIKKKNQLTCHFELGGAYYIRCAFLEDIKPCHLCGALKALCRVAAQFRLAHGCALRSSPLSLSELLSIIQWPQMFNRQKPRPKYWETFDFYFYAVSSATPFLPPDSFPSSVPFCLFFLQDPNLSFSLTYCLHFPCSLSGTSQLIPVFIWWNLTVFSLISWILLDTPCFPK